MSIIRTVKCGLRNLISLPAFMQKLKCEQRKNILQQNILFKTEPGISSTKICNSDIIVSLTTYGERLHDVALTIESLMEQTLKANKIILWLSEDEKEIPASLKLLAKRGLDIQYCKDLRSYKKLIPALKKYPRDIIITVDDDVFYEYDLIENLVTAHLAYPRDILAHRMHRIKLDSTGNVMPYMSWDQCVKDESPSFLNFAVGVGGVLYPPDSLDNRVFDESVFAEICKYGDDIWFKAMSILRGTKTRSVFSHDKKGEDYCENATLSDQGLFSNNVLGDNLNDTQIKAVFQKYKITELLSD